MRVIAQDLKLNAIRAELVVVAVQPSEIGTRPKKSSKSNSSFHAFDLLMGHELSTAIKRAGFRAESGTSLLVPFSDGRNIGAVMLIGAPSGKESRFDEIQFYRKLGSKCRKAAKSLNAQSAILSTANLDFGDEAHLTAIIEGVMLSSYRFDRYKSEKKERRTEIKEIILLSSRKISEKVVDRAIAFCDATSMARDLINMPPNDGTPSFLAKTCQEIARKGRLKIKVFDGAELKKLGANSLLAVSRGSDEPPFLLKMVYLPPKRSSRTKIVSVVGKGVTFDTGGYSIKTGNSMEGMKMDMSGAAAVIGVMQAVAKLQPNVEVRGYIPTCENMINGSAMRPGDIVKAMNGKTIEILNTDAEGRLILADALVMASRDKPHVIIDLATLTGACVVALGLLYAAIFANDERLSDALCDAGDLAGERFWKLPLAPEYREDLKSPVADLKNIGPGRWAGAIHGALFLEEFVSDIAWAHLDIAGPADTEKDSDHLKRGGVGFGIRTILRYILSQ